MNKGILAIFSVNTPAVVAGVMCMLAYNKMSASSSSKGSIIAYFTKQVIE